jgi:protein-tyrosine phosphatase
MIQRGIQFIRDMQAEGRTVYVHCKAGVGRSATIVAGKLLQDGLANGTKFPSADAAIQYIRSIRNHVTIYKGHARAAIVQFFQRLHAKT